MLTSRLGGRTVGLPIHLPPFQICCPHNTQHTRLGLQSVTQEHPSPDCMEALPAFLSPTAGICRQDLSLANERTLLGPDQELGVSSGRPISVGLPCAGSPGHQSRSNCVLRTGRDPEAQTRPTSTWKA